VTAAKARIALSIFKEPEDLADTISILRQAGIASEHIVLLGGSQAAGRLERAGLGTPPPPRILRNPDGAWQRRPEGGAGGLWASERIADFRLWTTEKVSADLEAAIDDGAIILLAAMSGGTSELAVSRLLLSTPALAVQLHDLGA